jgi:hypothetical protein
MTAAAFSKIENFELVAEVNDGLGSGDFEPVLWATWC